ncbi:MAG: pre-peptidase C-terminal domain-containing protein [Phormidesmis sp.]
MANYDLDTLSSEVVSRDYYGLTTTDPTDVFEFDISNTRSINLSLHNISSGDDADLRLYEDSNGNGVLDSSDQLVASSLNASNANDSIDYLASAGTYFAEVSRYDYGSSGSVSYNLDLSATYNIGGLSSQISSQDSYYLSSSDPTDVFEFSIANSRNISLYLHDISAGDDADLYLYEDSNGNGIFDSDDQQVASSLNGSNTSDSVDYQASAGTYFAEVSRYDYGSSGSVSYNLDLSATYGIGELSSQIVSQDNYSLTTSDPTDVFEFNIANNRNISLHLHDISAGDDADLYLYEDSNGNGIFDSDDQQVASSTNGSNTNDSIDYQASAGTYFAEVSRYDYGSSDSVSYNLDLSATYDVGTLSTVPVNRDNYGLSESDPTDVFEFEISSNQEIDLSLHNISAGDDADLYLYEDSNGNGIFDSDDQQVASSMNGSNADDTINYQASTGIYFAEVSRYDPGSSGSVSYDLELSVGAVTPPTTPTPPTNNVPVTYQSFDASQVFSLNSNAGANHTIYLDFDGHTMTDTLWNQRYANGTSITNSAYDTDGDASSFSIDEREAIWEMWQRVAEDFMPFDVNVTTSLSSTDQLINTGGSDTQWGARIVIGGNSSWSGDNVAGFAFLGTFGDSVDTPGFSFSEGRSTLAIAETITHEAGHMLGLEHDGTTAGEEYYSGHNTGFVDWAPIMGGGNAHDFTQWSQGEYNNANNREDDLDIITGNGFGYRADDYGDSLTNAAALSVNGGMAEGYGIIETNTDVDWFSFTSSTGNIDLDINPFDLGPNLDIMAELRDSVGQVISTFDTLGSLATNVTANLNPGQYFLTVTGTGEGNPVTGYSDYGSLGQYSIDGTIA